MRNQSDSEENDAEHAERERWSISVRFSGFLYGVDVSTYP